MSHLTTRRFLSLFVVITAQAFDPLPAPAQPATCGDGGLNTALPYTVRLGYTTFDSPEKLRTEPRLQWLGDYFRRVSERSWCSDKSERPLQFDVMHQIWRWFRNGQLDAAVVSPFMAMLLQREMQALPAVEFSEDPVPAGHEPMIAACGAGTDNPRVKFDDYLSQVLTIAQNGIPGSGPSIRTIETLRPRYRVNFVAHLSSSGFIMPVLYVDRWLKSKSVDTAVQSIFWDLFFDNMRLMLAHGSATSSTAETEFFFSDNRRPDTQWECEAANGGMSTWKPYWSPSLGDGRKQPSVPNDVLMLHPDAALTIAPAVFGELRTARKAPKPANHDVGYSHVRPVDASVQGPFQSLVEGMVRDSPAIKRWSERWFHQDKFDFTIEETIALLRQDQEIRGRARLALVLSGGGVKSLYQTVLLDYMYGLNRDSAAHPLIRNVKKEPSIDVAATPRQSASPLIVHTIIGTSGGAMLAFFAAQVPIGQELTSVLSDAAARRLFPLFDVARVLSGTLLIALFVLIAKAARALKWFSYRWDASSVEKKALRWNGFTAAVILFAGAVVMAITREDGRETVAGQEGALFALTAIALHFGITCVGRSVPGRVLSARRRTLALARVALGALLIGVAIGTTTIGVSFGLLSAPEWVPLSLLAGAAVFLAVGGLLGLAAGGCCGTTLLDVREYGLGLLALATFLMLAYLPVVVLDTVGWATLLELTLDTFYVSDRGK